MEIAEEEEEEERERKRQSVVKEDDQPKSPRALPSEAPVKLDADLANLPDASQYANGLEPPHFTGAPRPSSPTRSFDDTSRRMSSQSSRTTDLYPATSYPYLKPRVKLGPRPSADPGRPGSSAGSTTPRVSTVPAGLKSMSKGPKKSRSHSQTREEEAPESPIQEQAEEPFPSFEVEAADADGKHLETELAQPELSSETQGVVAPTSSLNINMPAPAQPPTKQNTMTPEKARLLKAMKLREKKKLMSLQPTLDVPAADIPSAPSTPGLPEEGEEPATIENVASAEEAPHAAEEGPQDGLLAVSQPDSAIDVDHASVDTPMDSHPASPLGTSETGESTQASSLSDSTDETVLAKDEHLDREGAKDEAADNKPAASTRDGNVPPKEPIDEAEPALRDRQSQITITAATKDDVPENNVGEPAVADSSAGDAVSETPQVLPPSDAPDTPGAPEKDTSDATPTEPAAPTPDAADVVEPTDAAISEEEKAPSPQVRIPTSKFSTTQESKSPTSAAAQDTPSILATPDVDSWRVGESAPPVPEKDSDVDAVGAAGTEPQKRKFPEPIRTDLHASDNDKRRSVITIADNDGFMDELQSATVEQATPIMVAKSPISPFFSVDQTSKRTAGAADDAQRLSTRTVSNPVRNSYLGPVEAPPGPVRSASSGTAYLSKVAQQQADLRPKSAKLGSSISQRIKALEKLSSVAPGVETAPSPKERPASAFFSVRKASTREPSRPPSVIGDRAGSVTGRASPAPPPSRDSSPETTRNMGRGRSGSVVNRLSMFEGGAAPRGRPDSVQVTARIVRDPNQPFAKGGLVDYGPLDLKQSPLSVDVQNRDSRSPVRPPSGMSVRTVDPREIAIQAKQSLLERRISRQSQEVDRDSVKGDATQESRPRRRSSLSVMKDYIKDRTESIIGGKSPSTDNLGNPLASAPGNMASPSISQPPSRAPSVHQPGSLARRLSISSRRSSIEQSSPALSSAVLSPAPVANGVAEPESDKNSLGPASPKSNRATRFMRRLSNTLVTSRKNTTPSISPTVAEENAAEVEAASRGSTATGVAAQAPPKIDAFMGDVNVQFPDNLLWKRRSICLDNQGFLILSSVQGTAMLPSAAAGKDRHGALIKRYHMSDFKPPYAPDVELQELPNSVVLDIVNGSGLQIACEDRAGQMSILRSEYFPRCICMIGKEQELTNFTQSLRKLTATTPTSAFNNPLPIRQLHHGLTNCPHHITPRSGNHNTFPYWVQDPFFSHLLPLRTLFPLNDHVLHSPVPHLLDLGGMILSSL